MTPGEAEGRIDAPIVIVGEAWGQNEEFQKRPFVGPSGYMLQQWLTSIGCTRHDCYITNVVPMRPPNNDFSKFDKAVVEHWIEQLHARLATLTDPKVIVVLGNHALKAVTNSKLNITAVRGSIMSYSPRPRGWSGDIPVVPILHPAAVLRSSQWNGRCLRDWKVVRAILDGRTRLASPEVLVHVWPSGDAEAALTDILRCRHPISIDIETIPDKRIITSVAVAAIPQEAVVFDLLNTMHGNPIAGVRGVCHSPKPKIMQNGFYDWYWLEHLYGIPVANFQFDTRWMHHALDPADEHSLAYLASKYTSYDPWKHMGKSKIRAEQLMYNGMDAAITVAVYRALEQELALAGLMDFYIKHYAALFEPLFIMMRRGIAVDSAKRGHRRAELMARCAEIRSVIDGITGKDIDRADAAERIITAARLAKLDLGGVKGKVATAARKEAAEWARAAKAVHKEEYTKSIFGPQGESPLKLQRYLYDTLKIPRRTRGGNTSADEAALRGIRLRYGMRDPKLATMLDGLLEFRGKYKLASTFLSDKIEDADGRVRCEYTFTPKNGRLSSSENPLDKGMNLQNVSREVRDIFVPDHGDVILEVDLSQAEWRVVAALTRDAELIRLANSRPSEFDIHKHNATLIFGGTASAVTKDQRYLAKRACHAADYGMQAKKLQEILLMDGVVRTENECKSMIEAYFRACPAIPAWQRAVRAQVMRHRALTNSWGRRILFTHDRLDDELYRLAYAWRPSSEVADLLNQYGVIPAHKANLKAQLQVHDALYIGVQPEDAYDAARTLQQNLERPRSYDGIDLTIPCTFTLHDTWGSGVEYHELPTREKFTEDARRLARRWETPMVMRAEA